MSLPLIIRPKAEDDMAEAREWYDEKREGLGSEFLMSVEGVFDLIRKSPELYAAEYKAVRRAKMDRFPYIVYYRILGGGVEVIAILHGSRSSRRCRSRA